MRTILPIVQRELLVTSRRKSFYQRRTAGAAIGLMILGWWLLTLGPQFMAAGFGRILFSSLSAFAFYYCLFAGAQVTADALSAEKREGTLGLLFLTDLKGFDVVMGKLAGTSLSAIYALLGAVPVFYLTVLFGGVTVPELIRLSVVLLSTLFLSLSAGLLISCISRNDRKAMMATVGMMLVLAFGPFVLGKLLSPNEGNLGWADVDPGFVILSPYFAYQLVVPTGLGRLQMAWFWESIAASQLLSWGFLTLASISLRSAISDRTDGSAGSGWWRRIRELGHGAGWRRSHYRNRLLEVNPYYWLAARDRWKAGYVWIFIAAVTVIWMWVNSKLGEAPTGVFLVAFFLVQAIAKYWYASEACLRLMEDRRSGGLELLVCTPLSPALMARGQGQALRRQFALPLIGLMAGAWWFTGHYSDGIGVAMFVPYVGRQDPISWTLFMVAVVPVFDLIALKWMALWQALRSRSLNRAIQAAAFRILIVPWLVLLGWRTVSQLGGAYHEFGYWVRCWFWLSLSTDVVWGLKARFSVLHQLRKRISEMDER